MLFCGPIPGIFRNSLPQAGGVNGRDDSPRGDRLFLMDMEYVQGEVDGAGQATVTENTEELHDEEHGSTGMNSEENPAESLPSAPSPTENPGEQTNEGSKPPAEIPTENQSPAAEEPPSAEAPAQPQENIGEPDKGNNEEGLTSSSVFDEEENTPDQPQETPSQPRKKQRLKNHKPTQSVPPSLLKIPAVLSKVADTLPSLFVSSAMIVELQANLKNINASLACASRESSTVAELRGQFKTEWTRFVDGIDKIVEINETENIREFCRRQLPSVERTVQRMRGKAEILEKRPKTKQEFDAIDVAFQDAAGALEENLGNFRRSLRALLAAFQGGNRIIKLITASESEMELVKKTNVDFVNMMLEFISNAENGVTRRKGVKVVCSDALKEINALFDAAAREEKRIRDVEKREADKDKPIRKKEEKLLPPAAKLQPTPIPKHTAVTRPPLFEERKRVGGLGPTRSPRGQKSRSRQGSRGSSRNSGRQSPLPTEKHVQESTAE